MKLSRFELANPNPAILAGVIVSALYQAGIEARVTPGEGENFSITVAEEKQAATATLLTDLKQRAKEMKEDSEKRIITP